MIKFTILSVVILCANTTTVREIMLAADELGMVSTGEYAFFNIELYSRYTKRHYLQQTPLIVFI